jgi:hypothetical protein
MPPRPDGCQKVARGVGSVFVTGRWPDRQDDRSALRLIYLIFSQLVQWIIPDQARRIPGRDT